MKPPITHRNPPKLMETPDRMSAAIAKERWFGSFQLMQSPAIENPKEIKSNGILNQFIHPKNGTMPTSIVPVHKIDKTNATFNMVAPPQVTSLFCGPIVANCWHGGG